MRKPKTPDQIRELALHFVETNLIEALNPEIVETTLEQADSEKLLAALQEIDIDLTSTQTVVETAKTLVTFFMGFITDLGGSFNREKLDELQSLILEASMNLAVQNLTEEKFDFDSTGGLGVNSANQETVWGVYTEFVARKFRNLDRLNQIGFSNGQRHFLDGLSTRTQRQS